MTMARQDTSALMALERSSFFPGIALSSPRAHSHRRILRRRHLLCGISGLCRHRLSGEDVTKARRNFRPSLRAAHRATGASALVCRLVVTAMSHPFIPLFLAEQYAAQDGARRLLRASNIVLALNNDEYLAEGCVQSFVHTWSLGLRSVLTDLSQAIYFFHRERTSTKSNYAVTTVALLSVLSFCDMRITQLVLLGIRFLPATRQISELGCGVVSSS